MKKKNSGSFKKGHIGYKAWLGKHLTIETKKKLSVSLKGRKLSKETKIKMKGRIPWNKGKKGLQISSRKNRKFQEISGKNHWNWKGGISKNLENLRKGLDYQLWRENVLKRDNFTCQICGRFRGWNKDIKKRVIIEADHIKSFSLYPETRFDIDNGRTLCKECHINTENWGNNSRIFI